MAQAPRDAWMVTVLSTDLDLIEELAEPGEALDIQVGAPRRFPGAADTFGQVIAVLQNLDIGVAGSLIAAWIWEARARARGPRPASPSTGVIKARLSIRRPEGEIELELEAGTQAEATAIIAAALNNTRLDV